MQIGNFIHNRNRAHQGSLIFRLFHSNGKVDKAMAIIKAADDISLAEYFAADRLIESDFDFCKFRAGAFRVGNVLASSSVLTTALTRILENKGLPAEYLQCDTDGYSRAIVFQRSEDYKKNENQVALYMSDEHWRIGGNNEKLAQEFYQDLRQFCLNNGLAIERLR